MSSRRELLALRKDVLVARAALQRAAIAHEVGGLRASVRWPRSPVASAPIGRSLLLGVLLLFAGRRRVTRFVRLAAGALAVAKLAAVVRAQRRPASTAVTPAPPEPASAE